MLRRWVVDALTLHNPCCRPAHQDVKFDYAKARLVEDLCVRLALQASAIAAKNASSGLYRYRLWSQFRTARLWATMTVEELTRVLCGEDRELIVIP